MSTEKLVDIHPAWHYVDPATGVDEHESIEHMIRELYIASKPREVQSYLSERLIVTWVADRGTAMMPDYQPWIPGQPIPPRTHRLIVSVRPRGGPITYLPAQVLCERCDQPIENHGGHWRHSEDGERTPCPRACPPTPGVTA